MNVTTSFYQAATVPPRRTGGTFTNPKFSPRLKSTRRFTIYPKAQMDEIIPA